MKTTPFIKRLFASVFTAVTLATLATVSLNQSAFAAVADEDSLVDMDPVEITGYKDSISNGTIREMGWNADVMAYTAILNCWATIGEINNVKIVNAENVNYQKVGIYNMGGTINTISDVDIEMSSSNSTYGIYNQDYKIGSISNTTIAATSTNSEAYGIYNMYGSIDSISNTTITAISNSSSAYALYDECDGAPTTWNFGGNTTLIANGGLKSYAIYTTGNTTLTSLDSEGSAANATVSMTGDIYVGYGYSSLTIASGNYVLAGDSTTITASGVNINEGASLTLTGLTTFTNDTLILNVDTLTAAAMLVITEGASVDGLSDIYIILSGDAAVAGAWDDAMLSTIISDAGGALNGISYTVYSGSDIVSTGVLSSIPEPSTATLSLPALAGLCARRRRCRKAA